MSSGVSGVSTILTSRLQPFWCLIMLILPGIASYNVAMGSLCTPLIYLTVHAPEAVATDIGSVSHARALVSSGASECC